MKNYLPKNFKNATLSMVVFLSLILTSIMSAEAQDCSIVIDDPGCPVNQTVCADAVLNSVTGHYLNWEEPQFSLSCTTGTPTDYSFYMEYNLPESQQTCWVFSGVQRVGTNNLRLWQSSGNGEIYFITPKVFIDNNEAINLDLINPNNRNITWRLIVLDENMVEVWSDELAISGSGEFSINLDPSEITSGNHYLKFQFLGNGNNSIYVDRIYFDAILADAACGGGINFSVTSSHNPGSFFPVGETTVSYTATFIPVSGSPITESCDFTVTVNEISSASVSKEDATCNLSNGKITIQATSSSNSPVWKYSLDNGISWNSFNPGVAITDLSVGTYNITIKDESTGCSFEDVLTATIINAPSVTAPVPVVLALPELQGKCSVTVDAIPTALDACGNTVTGTTVGELTFNTQGTYTLTWNYVDGYGNSSSQTQTVVVDDVTAPVPAVAELPEVKGECSVTVSAPTATDNCEGEITGTTNDPLTYDVQGTYTITWTYDDGNGNISSQTQSVVVDDTTAPVPAVEVLAVVKGECSVTIANAPVANDNCAGEITGTTNDPLTYDVQGTYTITWTYDDGKGNTTTQTQSVVVDDTTAPVPAVAQLEEVKGSCSVSVTAPTANDNCAGVITGTTTDATTYTVPGTYTINWIYSDGNGNSTSQSQTVTVEAYSAPVPVVAQLPALTGECQVVVTTAPTATLSCGGTIEATTNDPLTYNAQGNYTITWTYDDGKGNISTQTQSVVIDDTTAPVPAAAQLDEVKGSCSVTVASAPVANDNCAGVITGTTTDAITYTVPGTYTINWIYSDGNGNSTSQSQTVTVEAYSAPVPVVAQLPALTGECQVVVTTIPTATVNCGGTIEAATNDPLTYSAQGNYTITWTYDDGKGNISTQTQSVVVDDITAPVPAVAELDEVKGACSVSVTAPTANDNCAGIITGTTTDATTYTVPGTYTINWIYSDGNGNSASQSQTVTVEAYSAPVPVVAQLPALTGECQVVVTTVPTATVSCQEGTIKATTNDPLTYSTQGTYTITWTYDDGNGNTATQTQSVVVKDITVPEIEGCIIEDILIVTAGCEAILPDYASQLSVTDNCNNGITLSQTPSAGTKLSAGNHVVTIGATDIAGNTTTCKVYVTVVDETKPVFTFVPENIEIECGLEGNDQLIANWLNSAVATDNCQSISVINDMASLEAICEAGETVTVTWTASDNSGNQTTASATITLIDTRIPTFGNVENMTVECDGTGNLEDYENFKSQFVADNVEDVVTFEEVVTPGCGNTKSIMVTATATTLTGAQSTATATFTIIDTTSPSLVVPANIAIEADENCEWDAQPVVTGMATASDACSGENGATVTYQDEVTELGGGQYEIVRTWTATDACGNESNGQQVITVAGTNAAPELTLNPIDIYLTESGEWTLNRWNIEDITRGSFAGCGTGDLLTYTFSNRYFDCSSVYAPQEVTVTATDSYGNSASGKVVVNVFDTIAPMAFCKDTTIYLDSNGQAFIVPGAINMGGDRESVPAWARHHNDLEGGSIDACGIAFMEISQQLFTTENIGANQVTLTVYDPSGNFATCEAIVTVIDTLRQPNYEEGEDTYYESSEGQESNTDTNETGTVGQDDSAQESETAEETNIEYTIAGTINTTFGDGAIQPTGTIEVILMLDGTVVATTVTDEEGNYIFEGLTAGSYEVIVVNEENNQENAVAVTVDAENPVASQVNVVVVTVRDNAIVTSTVQFENGMQMQVYPNPTQGQVRIDLEGSHFRQAEVTVYNVLGAMVYRQSFSTSSDIVFDLSSEASGMYIVKVDSEGISATRKLILDRK